MVDDNDMLLMRINVDIHMLLIMIDDTDDGDHSD